MKVDREVEPRGAQPAAEAEIAPPPGPRHDQHIVEVRVAGDDGRGGGFDEIREVGVGKAAADGANGRCREDDVANLAQPDEEDPGELRN